MQLYVYLYKYKKNAFSFTSLLASSFIRGIPKTLFSTIDLFCWKWINIKKDYYDIVMKYWKRADINDYRNIQKELDDEGIPFVCVKSADEKNFNLHVLVWCWK